MNTTIDGFQQSQQPVNNAKPLWAAVGILGVAVLGMGGSMLYQAGITAAPAAQLVAAAPVMPAALAKSISADPSAADDLIEKPAAAPARPAPAPAKKVVKPTPKATPVPYASPYPSSYPSPYPVPSPVAVVQICSSCGAVESVTPIQRSIKPDGPGVGAVAGGVAGAVLGNRVGQGNGRTVATILGAIGGGFAGNAIEKNVRKETVYQVGVRMEDDSLRTVEVAQPPAVGSRVTVDGSSIRSNNGGVYNAPAPVMQRTSQQTPVYRSEF